MSRSRYGRAKRLFIPFQMHFIPFKSFQEFRKRFLFHFLRQYFKSQRQEISRLAIALYGSVLLYKSGIERRADFRGELAEAFGVVLFAEYICGFCDYVGSAHEVCSAYEGFRAIAYRESSRLQPIAVPDFAVNEILSVAFQPPEHGGQAGSSTDGHHLGAMLPAPVKNSLAHSIPPHARVMSRWFSVAW